MVDEGKNYVLRSGARRVLLFAFCICGVGLPAFCLAQGSFVMDFNKVSSPTDFFSYSEDNFLLTSPLRSVRINDAFSPGDFAAQPSAGFGQGVDSSLVLTSRLNLLFRINSIDLLEATGFPEQFGLVFTGTRSDLSQVSQTFTLDGIPGAQTFSFSAEFSGLTSLRISEDPNNAFFTEAVQIDNLGMTIVPEPSTLLLCMVAGIVVVPLRVVFGRRGKRDSNKTVQPTE